MEKEKLLRTDGWADEWTGAEGSTRGPRGPKTRLIAVYVDLL